MKVFKVIIGIISVIGFFAIFTQSCIIGGATRDMSPAAGAIMGFLILFAGLTGITMPKSKLATTVAGVLYSIAAIIGYTSMAAHPDLKNWAIAATVFGVAFLALGIFVRKEMTYGEKPKFKMPKQ
jgi:hypothetical protein